jgi:RNA polymerase-interacting CarD/CdnL/TRCF family regulator
MDIHRGDHVVHPRFGVGTVITIEIKHLTGEDPRVFYRVDFSNTTLWVPVTIPKTGGLRPVTPKNDLPHYRQLLKSSPVTLDNDFRIRKLVLDERLKEGTFQALCEVVRDLRARLQIKSLSNYESGLYRQAYDALVDEWAAASKLSIEEANREVESLLHKGNHSLPSS